MKKLGLIGGTGPESTLIYYKDICSKIFEHTKTDFPEIVLESINLTKASGYMQEKNYTALIEYLLEAIHHLIDSGAEIIALTAVTMHAVYDDLKKMVSVPFISIPEATAQEALRVGYHRVGLLGTKFTMSEDYLKKSFVSRGIEVIVPKKEEMTLVHQRIFTELEAGIVKEATVKELISIIERMRDEDGIEAVILGCTELPLALSDKNSPIPVLDAMAIHIEQLVKQILE